MIRIDLRRPIRYRSVQGLHLVMERHIATLIVADDVTRELDEEVVNHELLGFGGVQRLCGSKLGRIARLAGERRLAGRAEPN